MNSFNSDSLEDSRCEVKLLEQLNLKDNIIKEKENIIASVRNVNEGLLNDIEELKKVEQKLRQELTRSQKRIEEKDQELESISHCLKEAETTNEALIKKYDLRREQFSKIFQDLVQAKKELDEFKLKAAENEALAVKLESKNCALNKENIDLKRELNSTERYAQENIQLELKINDLTKQITELQEKKKTAPVPAAIHFSVADEVGEFMDSTSLCDQKQQQLDQHYYPHLQKQQQQNDLPLRRSQLANQQQNHRIQKSSFFHSDPIEEEKMRLDRMNELARRNKLTKPLHQTSYALELETWDQSANENDIKRGNVHNNNQRKALADFSNQRKPVKKAEAFIV